MFFIQNYPLDKLAGTLPRIKNSFDLELPSSHNKATINPLPVANSRRSWTISENRRVMKKRKRKRWRNDDEDRVESRWNSSKGWRVRGGEGRGNGETVDTARNRKKKERRKGGREKKKRSGKQGEKRDRERGSRGRQWSTVTTNYTIVGRFTMEQLRAAGWADGMSFSPFAGEKTILVPILSPHDTLIPLFPSLSLPLCPDLFLRLEASHSGLRAVCRLHKVIILRSPRGYRVRGGEGG